MSKSLKEIQKKLRQRIDSKQLTVKKPIKSTVSDSESEYEFSKDHIRKIPHVRNLEELRIQVQKLIKAPQHEQRTEGWYAARKLLITASEAASALFKSHQVCDLYMTDYNLTPQDFELNPEKGCNPYMTKEEFFLKKCGEIPFTGNVATRHGQKYEDVAAHFYARLMNVHLLEFGLIQHPRLDWLGASPDGITTNGVMLEIKCPYRRKITGIPPFYYWVQVQLQLEVCNLEYCDFLECIFDQKYQYSTAKEFLDQEVDHFQKAAVIDKFGPNKVKWDGETLGKGLILLQRPMKDKSYEDCVYYYPPPEMSDPMKLLEWAENEIKRVRAALTIQNAWKEYHLHTHSYRYKLRPLFWRLTDIHIARIRRNQEWFNTIRPILRKAFEDMQWYQENGTSSIHTAIQSKKKKSKRSSPKGRTLQISNWLDNSSNFSSKINDPAKANKCLIMDSDSD